FASSSSTTQIFVFTAFVVVEKSRHDVAILICDHECAQRRSSRVVAHDFWCWSPNVANARARASRKNAKCSNFFQRAAIHTCVEASWSVRVLRQVDRACTGEHTMIAARLPVLPATEDSARGSDQVSSALAADRELR